MTANDLIALIGSRICHDLISPLGAIGNGVELLSMSGMGSTPEIALIAESVESANARIRFFRVAYAAAPRDDEIGHGEVQSIMRETYKGGRIRVDWGAEGALQPAQGKLAFLLLQCLENTLPWGGQIVVRRNGNDWQLEARGEKLKVDARLWGMLTDPTKMVDWLAPGEIELKKGGSAKLNFVDSGIVIDSLVSEFEPLKLLEYSWSGPGEPERPLRWELTPVDDATRLTLTLSTPGDEDIARSCAGWEAHLMMLLAAIEGVPIKFPFERFQATRESYNGQL